MGSREYAKGVVKILDPKSVYFNDRILSRDEHILVKHTKELKNIFPFNDNMVVVVDDRIDVWCGCPNLITIKPFLYFKGKSTDINHDVVVDIKTMEGNFSESKDAELMRVLQVLDALHTKFYQFYDKSTKTCDRVPDIKLILSKLKSNVLKGTKIVFFTRNKIFDKNHLFKEAILWGAKCQECVTKSTTHLVLVDGLAEKNLHTHGHIFQVTLNWFFESIWNWQKQDENKYAIE